MRIIVLRRIKLAATPTKKIMSLIKDFYILNIFNKDYKFTKKV